MDMKIKKFIKNFLLELFDFTVSWLDTYLSLIGFLFFLVQSCDLSITECLTAYDLWFFGEVTILYITATRIFRLRDEYWKLAYILASFSILYICFCSFCDNFLYFLCVSYAIAFFGKKFLYKVDARKLKPLRIAQKTSICNNVNEESDQTKVSGANIGTLKEHRSG